MPGAGAALAWASAWSCASGTPPAAIPAAGAEMRTPSAAGTASAAPARLRRRRAVHGCTVCLIRSYRSWAHGRGGKGAVVVVRPPARGVLHYFRVRGTEGTAHPSHAHDIETGISIGYRPRCDGALSGQRPHGPGIPGQDGPRLLLEYPGCPNDAPFKIKDPLSRSLFGHGIPQTHIFGYSRISRGARGRADAAEGSR